MKLNTPKRNTALVTKNVQQLRSFNDKPIQDTPYHNLLYVLADMMDLIGKGENWYVIMGATKNKDAFSMTVVHDDDRVSAYAEDFGGLCLKARDFL